MRKRLLIVVVACGYCLPAVAQDACPAFTPVPTSEIRPMKAEDRIFRFEGGFVAIAHEMAVDTDGSPFAYHPRDRGTSFLCDGVDPYDETRHKCDMVKTPKSRCSVLVKEAADANWDKAKSGPFCVYGFDAPGEEVKGLNGKTLDKQVWGKGFGTGPIPVQKGGDPAPGFFLSTTAYLGPKHADGAGNRYINADKVPYVVVPGKLRGKGKVFSDSPTLAWAWDLKTGYASAAITGDTDGTFGEGSVGLAQMLEDNRLTPITAEQVLGKSDARLPFPYSKDKRGAVRADTGPEGTIVFVYFTKAGGIGDFSTGNLQRAVADAFKPFGGEAGFKGCVQKVAAEK